MVVDILMCVGVGLTLDSDYPFSCGGKCRGGLVHTHPTNDELSETETGIRMDDGTNC